MPFIELSTITGYLVTKGLDHAWSKATRSRKVLQVLRELGFGTRRPPSADFDTLYVYSLVEFGIGQPQALIKFFADERMEDAFRKAFSDSNRLSMFAAADKVYETVNAGAELQRIGRDPRQDFDRFFRIFDDFVNKVSTAVEIRQERKLNSLHDDLQSVQSQIGPLQNLPDAVRQIAQNAASTSSSDANSLMKFCCRRTEQTIKELSGTTLDDGPYLRDVYVERQRSHEAFATWLMSSTPCFAVVGRSGMGKTMFLCSLAEQSLGEHFVLFYRAKLLSVGLARAIADDIAWDPTLNGSSTQILQQLDMAATALGNNVIIFLDGLDEFPGAQQVLSAELAMLAQRFQGTHIKLCISCKDIDWRQFARDTEERPSALARLTEHVEPSPKQGRDGSLRAEEVGLRLDLFSDSELEGAFERYRDAFKLQGSLSGATQEACRTPLLLGLVAEIYSNSGDPILATLSSQQLLETFWNRRLGKVRHRAAAEELLRATFR